MKYLFLIIVLLSCRDEPRKVTVRHTEDDTTAVASVKEDATGINVHDPFQSGKDTARLNAIIEKIWKFPEVEAINRQITRTSKGKHGVAIMVDDEFDNDTSYYSFMVGDNSHDDRYVNIFIFRYDKKKGQIKVYDPIADSIISLQEWRKERK